MSRLTNILMAGFLAFVSPQLALPNVVYGGELNRKQPQSQNNEEREWPLSIPRGTHIFDAWGGPTAEVGIGSWSCSIDLPSIPVAVSTFVVEEISPRNIEWYYHRVREKVGGLVMQENERGKELFHLKFDTEFGTIASWTQGYTYSCVETLAVMTERGLRPLISVTESRHNTLGTKIRYDVFDRENNRFGTYDYSTDNLTFPNNGEMYPVSEEVMKDLHDALTLRVAMSEAKVNKNQKSVPLGWIKEETLISVVLNITNKDEELSAYADLTSYGGVSQPVRLKMDLVENRETGLYHFPISSELKLITNIGHGSLHLRD